MIKIMFNFYYNKQNFNTSESQNNFYEESYQFWYNHVNAWNSVEKMKIPEIFLLKRNKSWNLFWAITDKWLNYLFSLSRSSQDACHRKSIVTKLWSEAHVKKFVAYLIFIESNKIITTYKIH